MLIITENGKEVSHATWFQHWVEQALASHADVLTGSSRNHSSHTNDVRGVGMCDEPLRTFGWEARNAWQTPKVCVGG